MKIYIDMDGTLTHYDYDDYKNNKWKTQPSILTNKKPLLQIPKDWIILTSTSTPLEATLKQLWAHTHYPNNPIITLTPYQPKSLYARNNILIDDYNHNLEEWTAHGGYPVKLINNINSPRPDMCCIPQSMNVIRSEFITHDDGSHSVIFYNDEEGHRLYL